MKNKPSDFIGQRAIPPKEEDGYSFTSLKILPELYGCPWNETTMCYALALNQNCIRVVRGTATCDAATGRMTIWINNNDIIESITLETKIFTPHGKCGYDLSNDLRLLQESKGV